MEMAYYPEADRLFCKHLANLGQSDPGSPHVDRSFEDDQMLSKIGKHYVVVAARTRRLERQL